MSDQYTPTGGQTIFPRINFLKTFSSRFKQRSDNGRIFLSGDGGGGLFDDATLDLKFASTLSLIDSVSGNNLITFSRASDGTYVASDGLIKTAAPNTPRFGHDPVTGESLGLLIEEARTNLLKYSEQVDQSTWTKLQNLGAPPQITPNSAASPDGSTTADRILCSKSDNSSNAYSFVQQPAVYSGNETGSIYLKSNTNSNQTAYFKVGTTVSYVTVTTEWQRFSINSTFSGTANFTIGTRGTSDDVVDILAWGAQLETGGSFPTSYIPTTGSTVTRSPDLLTVEGTNFSSWFNQNEGTVFSDVTTQWLSGRSTNGTILQIDNGKNNTGRLFHKRRGNDGRHNFHFSGNDVTRAASTNSYKAASGYNTSSFITCVDESLSVEGNVVTGNLNTLKRAQIGNNGTNSLNGHISRLAYFPTRKTDQELIDLTKP